MPRSRIQQTRSASAKPLSREDLRSFLSKQSKERLIELLADAAFENEGLLGTLAVDMAGTLRGGRALASLRATVDEAMECLHCKGPLMRAAAPFSIDRKGYHIVWESIPAWVCTQCAEPLLEAGEVDAIQRVLEAVDRESVALIA